MGETLTLSTRLVDAVYKPLTGADLDVKVTSPSGKTMHIYPRNGARRRGYTNTKSRWTNPARGKFRRHIRTRFPPSEFSPAKATRKLDDPRAKPEAMKAFATATGGDAFSPDQAAELLKPFESHARNIDPDDDGGRLESPRRHGGVHPDRLHRLPGS